MKMKRLTQRLCGPRPLEKDLMIDSIMTDTVSLRKDIMVETGCWRTAYVYWAIMELGGCEEAIPMSIESVAKIISVGTSKINRAIDTLHKFGYIERTVDGFPRCGHVRVLK
jgi:hypothetical protein